MVKTRNDDAVKYTLYNVFLGAIKLLAPFMPHVTEDVYQEHFLKYEGVKSLHITEWPKPIFIDEDAEKAGDVLKDVIAAIRGWKSDKKIALNAELQLVQLIGNDAKVIESAKADIADTIKANEVQFVEKADLTEDYTAVKPVHAKLGPAFKADAKAIVAELAKMDPKSVADELSKGSLKVSVNGNDIDLAAEYVELEKRLMLNGKAVDTLQVGNILIIIEQ
jgi:valyl-tRNA synthetase